MIRKYKNRYMGFLLSFLFAFLLIPGMAKAEGYSCTVSVPVEVTLEGESAPKENFTVVMEAAAENTPMPEAAEQNVENSGKVQFGPVTYTAPGDYQYIVSQKAGNTENFTYDDTVYTVTVRVVNDGAGGLTAEIWAIVDGEQNKTDRIVFNNRYEAPAAPEKPAEPAKPAEPSKDNVQTGDTLNLTLLIAVIAAATVVIGITAAWKIRKKTSEIE